MNLGDRDWIGSINRGHAHCRCNATIITDAGGRPQPEAAQKVVEIANDMLGR